MEPTIILYRGYRDYMGSRDVGKDPQLCKPQGNVCFVVGSKQI